MVKRKGVSKRRHGPSARAYIAKTRKEGTRATGKLRRKLKNMAAKEMRTKSAGHIGYKKRVGGRFEGTKTAWDNFKKFRSGKVVFKKRR